MKNKSNQINLNNIISQLNKAKESLTMLLAKKIQKEEENIYIENLKQLKETIEKLIVSIENLINYLEQRERENKIELEKLHGQLNAIEKKIDDLFIKINYIVSLLKIEK